MFLDRNRIWPVSLASLVAASMSPPIMADNLSDFFDCIEDCGFIFQTSNSPWVYVDCADDCFLSFYACPEPGERPRFDLSAGSRPGSEAIIYEPGQEVELRVGRWTCNGFLSGRGEVVAVRMYVVGLRNLAAAPHYSSAAWQVLPTPVLGPQGDFWVTRWDSSAPHYPQGHAFLVEMDYPTTTGIRTARGVNIAVPNVGCYANCDGSTTEPVLNVADFGCFMQKFAGGDPYANCDGSTTPPVLNIADFACFMQSFAAGCR